MYKVQLTNITELDCYKEKEKRKIPTLSMKRKLSQILKKNKDHLIFQEYS